ncbi:hypothetical protein [Argonema antarcticum]|uniref:hypothetical protein n=1 Tax=Argonema antarcticum TaxID=2942763 RepID=UPI002012837D|nr:hypothetical protein [Argonema antarcticum]MCL1474888.1 hypothetical protein [Argonema antarcticum A004/B2]
MERTQRLTKVVCPAFPEAIPYAESNLLKYDLQLRTVCLQSALADQEVTTADLVLERYRESERRSFPEMLRKILNVYKVRALAIVKHPAISDVWKSLTSDLESRLAVSEHRWFKHDFQYIIWANQACEALLSCSGDAESFLEAIADAAEHLVRGAAHRLWIDLAERMMLQEAYRPLAYHLLERAARYVIGKPFTKPEFSQKILKANFPQDRRFKETLPSPSSLVPLVPSRITQKNVVKSQFSGRDRWQTLLRCALVVSQYDEELGRDYYKRSLMATESLDDDNVYLLSWLSCLAHQLAPFLSFEDRQNFSRRLARIVEEHKDYVSEPSELPWKATLGTVSRLDAANGLALCSLWDDENHFLLEHSIIPVVKEVTESGFLSPLEGFWLLRLAGERYDISEDAIPLLERLRTTGVSARPQLVQMMQALSYWIRRDVPLAERKTAATRIMEWADAHGMGQLAGIAELRELISFVSSLPSIEDRDTSSAYRPMTTRKFIVQDIINEARSGSLIDLESRLRQVLMNGDSNIIQEFLTALGRSVTPSQRVEYLNELISVNISPLLVYEIVIVLQTYLKEWGNSTIIQKWIPEGISKFLELHLPALLVLWYGSDPPLEQLLSLPNLTEQRTAILLPAIAQHLESLSPQELYTAAKSLAVKLPVEKLRNILDWSLTRSEMQIEQGTEMPPVLQTQLPDTSQALLAHFFWALFGHPDKRVRWRALHAARGIIKLPNQALLDELVKLSQSETAGMFRSPQLDFYWISARTWLMLLFERLAHECPQILEQHVQTIANHALNRDFPHAQIRELAKQTALRIVKYEPRSLPSDVIEHLKLVNNPSACIYPRENQYELPLSPRVKADKDRINNRFSFDETDTLRYWYNWASKIFGYTESNIVGRAEQWICDRWGRTDRDWYEDRRELEGHYDWRETSNSQGSIPRVESLHTYLEYHAMLCAAGEMIDELMPVAVETYEDAGCPWEEWIQGHLNVSPNFWLADLRIPTPYRPDSWGRFSPIKEWLKQYSLEEFDSGLGLTESGHSGEIVIWGHIDLYDYERVGHIRISSALVNPVTGRSLLCALQTTPNHRFQLPVKGRGFGEFEISQPGFELEPCLEIKRQKEEALDQFDPLAKQESSLEAEVIILDSRFFKSINLNKLPSRWEYASSDGSKIAYLEFWSDNLRERQVTQAFSGGKRWWINIESLLDYLNQGERDLIIEVQIAHNRLNNQREEGEEYDIGSTTIYLLRRDRILETLDSCRDIRQTDRERTRSGG